MGVFSHFCFPWGQGPSDFQGWFLEPELHPHGDAPLGLGGLGGLGELVPDALQEPQAAGQVAHDIQDLRRLQLGLGGDGAVGSSRMTSVNCCKRPSPLALDPEGQTQLVAGALDGLVIGEEIQHPVEFGHGLLELLGLAAPGGQDRAPQEESLRGEGGLDVIGLQAFQEEQGLLRLLVHLQAVPGHAQEGLGGEGGLGGGLQELTPGLEGLRVGPGGVGPFAGQEEPLRHVAVLGRQGEGQGEQQGKRTHPGFGEHDGLGRIGKGMGRLRV